MRAVTCSEIKPIKNIITLPVYNNALMFVKRPSVRSVYAYQIVATVNARADMGINNFSGEYRLPILKMISKKRTPSLIGLM